MKSRKEILLTLLLLGPASVIWAQVGPAPGDGTHSGLTPQTGAVASGGNLTLEQAIQEAKVDGVQQFDFGRSDYDNAGLMTFKDRWGSQRMDLTYWRLPSQSASGCGQWKLKVAGPIFARMPDRLLAACGRILYRHIG